MYSAFFAKEIQVAQMKRQLGLEPYRSHYYHFVMHYAFSDIAEPLLKWMHTGDLEIKSNQIKIFIHALKCFKVRVPQNLAEDLCIAIDHKWLNSDDKDYNEKKQAAIESGQKVLSLKELERIFKSTKQGHGKAPHVAGRMPKETHVIKENVD